jgi:hypothetical protein
MNKKSTGLMGNYEDDDDDDQFGDLFTDHNEDSEDLDESDDLLDSESKASAPISRSSVKSAESRKKTKAAQKLAEFAEGWNLTTVKTLVESLRRPDNLIAIPSNVNQEDAVGKFVFENALTLIRDLGPVTENIVQVNLDLKREKANAQAEKRSAQDELDEVQKDISHLLIEPKLERYQLRQEAETEDEIKAIQKRYSVLSSEGVITRGASETKGAAAESMEKEVADKINEVKSKYRGKYIKDMDEYEAAIKKKNNASDKLKELNRKYEKAQVKEIITNVLKNQLQQVAINVKTILVPHGSILSKLRGFATVRATGEVIVNPIDKNNLTGIMEILFHNYAELTFINTANAIMSTMSYTATINDSDNKPGQIATKVENMLADWEQHRLFDKLDKNLFWSVIAIKSINPQSSMHDKTLTALNSYLLTKRAGDEREDMSTFRFITTYLNQQQQIVNDQHKSRPKFENYKAGKTNDGTERAASASVSTTIPSTNQTYVGEVVKSDNVLFTHRKLKKNLPYIAVRTKPQLCSKCFPAENPDNPTNPCAKKCYAGQCAKCQYWGHSPFYCKHSKDIHGNNVQDA